MKWRNDLGWLIISLAFVSILYAYRLNFPGEMYFDEVYHVEKARGLITLNDFTQVTHPPFGELLIGLGIIVFGDHPWAWRFPPLISGIACLGVLFLLTKKLTQNSRVAYMVTYLFFCEGISLTLSRIAMLNTPMTLWMLLSLFFLIPYLRDDQCQRKKCFILSGIFFGLAVATRWVALGMIPLLGIFLLKQWSKAQNKKIVLKDILIFFVIVPTAIYFATWFIIPFVKGRSWFDIWKYQFDMLQWHVALKESHPYKSSWWSWPLMLRPIWYYFKREEGLVYGIFCIGNPAIFWLIPAAMGYAVWQFLKNKSFVNCFVIAGFLTQWLPWAFIGHLTFFHYFGVAMLFAVLALALFLDQLWRLGKAGQWIVMVYLTLVGGMFIYWYPLLSGLPISEPYFRNHLWFRSWY